MSLIRTSMKFDAENDDHKAIDSARMIPTPARKLKKMFKKPRVSIGNNP